MTVIAFLLFELCALCYFKQTVRICTITLFPLEYVHEKILIFSAYLDIMSRTRMTTRVYPFHEFSALV